MFVLEKRFLKKFFDDPSYIGNRYIYGRDQRESVWSERDLFAATERVYTS